MRTKRTHTQSPSDTARQAAIQPVPPALQAVAERPIIPRNYLTPAEAADYCRLSWRSLQRGVRRGQLAVIAMGGKRLFTISDLDAFLRRFRRPAVG